MAFQITAHLPLVNIDMPGSTFFTFSVLSFVVSFDILPMDDFYESTEIFTPTDAWSERYDFLKYDSINFIVLLGSIVIFILGFMLLLLLTLVKSLLKAMNVQIGTN